MAAARSLWSRWLSTRSGAGISVINDLRLAVAVRRIRWLTFERDTLFLVIVLLVLALWFKT
jgi:hypothetical protein